MSAVDRYRVNDALSALGCSLFPDEDLNELTHLVADAIDAGGFEAHVPVTTLADLMDECSEEGQWNGSDICDALATVIDRHGGWKRCDEHGVYSASNPECPWEH